MNFFSSREIDSLVVGIVSPRLIASIDFNWMSQNLLMDSSMLECSHRIWFRPINIKNKIKYPITLVNSTWLQLPVLLRVYKYQKFFISSYQTSHSIFHQLPLLLRYSLPLVLSAWGKWINFCCYSLPLVFSSFHILKLLLILPLNITASLTRAILCCN